MKQRSQISAILITKEKQYPELVLKHVESFGFGEIQIYTECDGIYRRFVNEPVYKDVYVQDDDCITPINEIFREYDGNHLTCGCTPHHINFYSDSKICLIGHGAFFPWARVAVLEKYKKLFGPDSDYLIETDRIFTFLNYPQKRIPVEVNHLPSSYQSDRLSMRKEHATNLQMVGEKLIKYQNLLM
jgi:hypothetical protein